MTEKYQPTKGEVLGEIVGGVGRKLTRENFSKVGKSVKEFSEFYIVGNMFMAITPYIMPYLVRRLKEHKQGSEDLSMAGFLGGTIGLVTGGMLTIGQIQIYQFAMTQDHSEVLLIPVATNAVSGVYEIGRKMYKNAKQRLIDKRQSDGLEATLQSTESTQK